MIVVYSIAIIVNIISFIKLHNGKYKINTYKRFFKIQITIWITIAVIEAIYFSIIGTSAFTSTIYGKDAFKWILFGDLLLYWPIIIFCLIGLVVTNFKGKQKE